MRIDPKSAKATDEYCHFCAFRIFARNLGLSDTDGLSVKRNW